MRKLPKFTMHSYKIYNHLFLLQIKDLQHYWFVCLFVVKELNSLESTNYEKKVETVMAFNSPNVTKTNNHH
jgi:hypothetical protein